MNLRFSASHWCLGLETEDVADAYRQLVGAGIEAIEMPPPAVVPLAHAAGLEVLNFAAPGMSGLALCRESEQPELLCQIERSIAAAAGAGARQLIVFSGNRQATPDEAGASATVEGLRRLIVAADRADVTLTLEVLNAYDHPDYMADRTSWAVDVVRRVGSPRVRLLYDVYHMHRMGEPVLDDLLEHLDLIAHVHIAGSPNRDFPGRQQAIAYDRVLPALLDAGYQGLVGLEFLPVRQPISEMIEAVHTLRRTLHEPSF